MLLGAEDAVLMRRSSSYHSLRLFPPKVRSSSSMTVAWTQATVVAWDVVVVVVVVDDDVGCFMVATDEQKKYFLCVDESILFYYMCVDEASKVKMRRGGEQTWCLSGSGEARLTGYGYAGSTKAAAGEKRWAVYDGCGAGGNRMGPGFAVLKSRVGQNSKYECDVLQQERWLVSSFAGR